MRTRTATLIAAIGLAGWVAHPATAQQAGAVGLEVTAGYNLMGGEDLDALDDALGFEAIGSYAFPTGLELGVGAGISTHDRPGLDDLDANMTNVFGEGRYRFGVPADRVPHLHPFLAGRIGWSSLSFDTTGDDASTTGLLIGGGGGLEYWLTDTVGLVGTALLQFLDYGSSDEVPGEISGTEVDLRAGLKVRF